MWRNNIYTNATGSKFKSHYDLSKNVPSNLINFSNKSAKGNEFNSRNFYTDNLRHSFRECDVKAVKNTTKYILIAEQ